VNITCPKHIVDLLVLAGLIGRNTHGDNSEKLQLQMITADGSQRNFFRIVEKGVPLCVGVSPLEAEGVHLAEAHAAMSIGRHLYAKDVAVPQIFAADEQRGVILFEDCGDTRLYDMAHMAREKGGAIKEQSAELYHKVIRQLVHMQIEGASEFDKNWCYDTPEYDHEVMIHKESGYFLRAFWCDLLGEEKPDGIDQEFENIAANAALGLPHFFLHRDFQCRNIMVVDSDVKFIDFQGGRFGPPGYDLASLLIDPYSSLEKPVRHEYLQLYLTELHDYIEYDEDVFLKQYHYLELQRNLQIIGAFAFLYNNRGKLFFKKYILPALDNLCSLLHNNYFRQYPNLQTLATEARSRLKKYI
jgi:N-acetylmuramate 1-kinase